MIIRKNHKAKSKIEQHIKAQMTSGLAESNHERDQFKSNEKVDDVYKYGGSEQGIVINRVFPPRLHFDKRRSKSSLKYQDLIMESKKYQAESNPDKKDEKSNSSPQKTPEKPSFNNSQRKVRERKASQEVGRSKRQYQFPAIAATVNEESKLTIGNQKYVGYETSSKSSQVVSEKVSNRISRLSGLIKTQVTEIAPKPVFTRPVRKSINNILPPKDIQSDDSPKQQVARSRLLSMEEGVSSRRRAKRLKKGKFTEYATKAMEQFENRTTSKQIDKAIIKKRMELINASEIEQPSGTTEHRAPSLKDIKNLLESLIISSHYQQEAIDQFVEGVPSMADQIQHLLIVEGKSLKQSYEYFRNQIVDIICREEELKVEEYQANEEQEIIFFRKFKQIVQNLSKNFEPLTSIKLLSEMSQFSWNLWRLHSEKEHEKVIPFFSEFEHNQYLLWDHCNRLFEANESKLSNQLAKLRSASTATVDLKYSNEKLGNECAYDFAQLTEKLTAKISTLSQLSSSLIDILTLKCNEAHAISPSHHITVPGDFALHSFSKRLLQRSHLSMSRHKKPPLESSIHITNSNLTNLFDQNLFSNTLHLSKASLSDNEGDQIKEEHQTLQNLSEKLSYRYNHSKQQEHTSSSKEPSQKRTQATAETAKQKLQAALQASSLRVMEVVEIAERIRSEERQANEIRQQMLQVHHHEVDQQQLEHLASEFVSMRCEAFEQECQESRDCYEDHLRKYLQSKEIKEYQDENMVGLVMASINNLIFSHTQVPSVKEQHIIFKSPSNNAASKSPHQLETIGSALQSILGLNLSRQWHLQVRAFFYFNLLQSIGPSRSPSSISTKQLQQMERLKRGWTWSIVNLKIANNSNSEPKIFHKNASSTTSRWKSMCSTYHTYAQHRKPQAENEIRSNEFEAFLSEHEEVVDTFVDELLTCLTSVSSLRYESLTPIVSHPQEEEGGDSSASRSRWWKRMQEMIRSLEHLAAASSETLDYGSVFVACATFAFLNITLHSLLHLIDGYLNDQ